MQSIAPFGKSGQFYKGNMHTHSTNSDGKYPPEKVIETYREAGYDFLVLTDHFMQRYGWKVSDTTGLRSDGFTTIVGAELHAPSTSLGELWHIKAIGLPVDFAPIADGETGPEVARRAAAQGAFIGIVHPSWYGLTIEDAKTIDVAHAVEIYNHGSQIQLDRGIDWPFCDTLLNDNWRVFGYASDDAHLWDNDCFGGWVQVHAETLCPDALLSSLKSGQFYSSQGPVIHHVEMDEETVCIECSPAKTVAVTGRGSKGEFRDGELLTQWHLPIKKFSNAYFRITVIDENGKRAWTNPVWLN